MSIIGTAGIVSLPTAALDSLIDSMRTAGATEVTLRLDDAITARAEAHHDATSNVTPDPLDTIRWLAIERNETRMDRLLVEVTRLRNELHDALLDLDTLRPPF